MQTGDSFVQYMHIDTRNEKHKEIILMLGKRNHFQWFEVYLHLYAATVPPGYSVTDTTGLPGIKDELAACDMHAILALDSTVTKKNPTGKEKVVGFVLYQINRDTKSQLHVLFLLVDKDYRMKTHGWNLMKKCEELHIFFIEENDNMVLDEAESHTVSMARSSGIRVHLKERREKMNGCLLSASGHDLVIFFKVKVQCGCPEFDFWVKLGYVELHTLPGLWSSGECADSRKFLVRAGPQTTSVLQQKRADY